MASGKSTIGSLLAERLNYALYDTDELISHWKQGSIEQVFKESGEKVFRTYETKMIRMLSELGKVVVSTGGGLPVHNDNISLLKNTGQVIYLHADSETLAHRILEDKQQRPLHSAQNNITELEREVAVRLKKREHIYSQAHITIDTATDLGTILDQILGQLYLS